MKKEAAKKGTVPPRAPTSLETLRRPYPNYIYGPVPSRRLGFSLGVDILPFKTCSMDCVYCQLGAVSKTTVRRKEYVPAAAVLAQIKAALSSGRRIDVVTFSGSGEPCLNSGIGLIIRGLKKITDIPVVVLTNSSCLASERCRRELAEADIVVPSLDAATAPIFKKINRPHSGLKINGIIDGLARFRRKYKGRIWLEIMLVKGLNDSPAHLKKLKAAVSRIKPDRIQLNTVVRPPAEKSARPLGRRELEKIRAFFGPKAEIIADFKTREQKADFGDIGEAILATVRRRPVTAVDISLSLGQPIEDISAHLVRLLAAGKIRAVPHENSVYYEKG